MTEDATAMPSPAGGHSFDALEMTAIAHLYRGEVYRSTIWRTRLDQTTNWAVVTTGLAMSLTFSGPYASPLPLILVGLLVAVFLLLKSRRYRYFNVWRARCRLIETDLYGPLLRGEGVHIDGKWNVLLANDYVRPRFHIGYWRAIGRRLRSNYAYILCDPGARLLRQARHPPAAGGDLDDLPVAGGGRAGAGLDRGALRRRLPRQLDRDRDRHLADRAPLSPGGGAADLDRLRRSRQRSLPRAATGQTSSTAPPRRP